MAALSAKRRNLFLALAVVFFVVFGLYSQPSLGGGRFKNVILDHDASGTKKPSSAAPDAVADDPAAPRPSEAAGPEDEKLQVDTTKISKLHVLIPASNQNAELCYNLVSVVANRFPPPVIVGWNATGEFSARVSHLNKMNGFQRYMLTLDPEDDDDLILIVDGYDIMLQLPAEVMLERYFEMTSDYDALLAQRFGLTVAEAHAQNLRQTIFWGPDKICWPFGGREARCWAIPKSTLGDKAFGPKSGNGEMYYSDPRWLNSGTVIGPAGDMRRYINETMEEIRLTYDAEFSNSESDQFYLANVWGRQEYWRSKKLAGDGDVPGGPKDRHIPEKTRDDQETELHVAIDYESKLFQTKAGYEPFFGYVQFNQSGLNAEMNRDMFDQGEDFEPSLMQMPPNVASSLTKIYDSIPDAHPGTVGADWIRTVNLGTNFVTKHIWALWHCTGPKHWIPSEYLKFWFYPYAKSLVKASMKAYQASDLIATHPIGGRMWAAKYPLPAADKIQTELGGMFSDYAGFSFVQWDEVCGEHGDVLWAAEDGTPEPEDETSDKESKKGNGGPKKSVRPGAKEP